MFLRTENGHLSNFLFDQPHLVDLIQFHLVSYVILFKYINLVPVHLNKWLQMQKRICFSCKCFSCAFSFF